MLRKLTHGLNNYFFDVQEDEEPDYVGAAFFYGFIIVSVGVWLFVTSTLILI